MQWFLILSTSRLPGDGVGETRKAGMIMEGRTKKQTGRGRKAIVVLVLLALVIFVAVVMVMNSFKPDGITLGKLDVRAKGGAFIRTNQIIIEQLYRNWMPNASATLMSNIRAGSPA